MAKLVYVARDFRAPTLEFVAQINTICAEYVAQGFVLTLRQLHYQLVSRALYANTQQNYKRLVDVCGDARLSGLIDWDAIEDRTRWLRSNSHWADPSGVLYSAALSYAIDKWANQRSRPLVLVEKDALLGVIGPACVGADVGYFACRGYPSLTELRSLGDRLRGYLLGGQQPVVFYLGDHDPSGLDMTRNLLERLELFCGQPIAVERLALNFDQIQQYNPPPNFAKRADSRYEGYVEAFGEQCWELDALDPATLATLVDEAIANVRDEDLWHRAVDEEKSAKTRLGLVARRWSEVDAWLDGKAQS
jgi:hypothetical protein